MNFARWSSDTVAEMHDIGWRGDDWNGAPQMAVSWLQQAFPPSWLVAYYREGTAPMWNPRQWNRAKLEKRGDIFFYYFNDHLLGIETGSVLPESAKLGFHINGTALLDNFKLTELVAPSTPKADISVTQTVSAPSVALGMQMKYTVAISNAGPATAANVTVTDTLPAGVLFVSAAGANIEL